MTSNECREYRRKCHWHNYNYLFVIEQNLGRMGLTCQVCLTHRLGIFPKQTLQVTTR